MEKLQRPMLIGGVILTGYLLLLQWQAYYSPSVPAQANPSSPIFEGPVSDTDTLPIQTPTELPTPTISDDLPAIPQQQQSAQDDPVSVAKAPKLSSSRYVIAETDALKIWIDLRGGDLVRAQLKQHREQRNADIDLSLLRTDNGRYAIAQSGLIGRDGPDASTSGRPTYSSERLSYRLAANERSLKVPLVYQSGDILVTKEFTLTRADYTAAISFIVENQSPNIWQGNVFTQFRRDDKSPLYEDESFGIRSFTGAALTTSTDNYKKLDFGDMDKKDLQEETQGGWLAMVQHYFVAAWVPADSQKNYVYSTRVSSNGHYIFGLTAPAFRVTPGETKQQTFYLYLGPKSQKPLDALGEYLALTIDYGWLWFISEPLFNFLAFIHSYVNNWGLAIILMTLIIKLIFFPLTNASYKSMARMRKLQPQIKSLREKHKDNRRQMQEEMMQLYKREKVNPMGGCLPILIQMPIFIAFYWTLVESVELRHAPFFGWITDLTSQDPYFILPILMGLSMFLQQQLSPSPPDPTQARIMKLLPVIFTIFFLWFPSGLVLYWLINNILSVTQQYIITRRLDPEQVKINLKPILRKLIKGKSK